MAGVMRLDPRRWIAPVAAVAALGIVAAVAFCFIRDHDLSASATVGHYEKTVIIDAGHGGADGGAVGADGTAEKTINLAISLKLRSFFEAGGFQVIMIRSTDCDIASPNSQTLRERKVSDIHNRFKIAESHPKALFLSIHQNLYTKPQYSGAQVFYSVNNTDSKVLAQSLQNAFQTLLQPQNDRVIKPAGKNLYILYHSHSPTVLVECGFLSNRAEEEKLEDDSYQNQVAFTIYSGALQFYALQGKTPPAVSQTQKKADAIDAHEEM